VRAKVPSGIKEYEIIDICYEWAFPVFIWARK
jgi:hypothetical protein